MGQALVSQRVRVAPWDLHVLSSTEIPAHSEPPVVLVHGLGISARHMVPAARKLAPELPVLLPDLPGSGRSAKPWAVLGVEDLAGALEGILDALGIEQAVFGAISFGCQVVTHLASTSPERVAACVLVGPTIDPSARNPVAQVARLLADAPREPLGLMPVILRDYFEFGPRRGAITLWHALADEVEGKLASIEAPTLVIRGANDPLVPRAWIELMASLLPQGSWAEIAGAAHAANFSHPGEFAELLLGHLEAHGLVDAEKQAGIAPGA